MAGLVVLSWVPETGYLVQARHVITTAGYDGQISNFTMGAVVLSAMFAAAVALTGLFAKLLGRARTATARTFAAADESLASAGTGSADPVPLRRARNIMLRWAVGCGFLAVVIIVVSGWALATGSFSARFAFMAPVLLLINLARFAQCMKAARKLRVAVETLEDHQQLYLPWCFGWRWLAGDSAGCAWRKGSAKRVSM
jgi:hypothetical protein